MLRYLMCRRVQGPDSCEIFRSFYTTTDPEAVERDLLGGGYGQGFDRTECIGIEVVDNDVALRSDGR
jgi:hypothetical protein